MSRVLVTGSTGFIGRHLIEKLGEKEAHKVIAVSRRVLDRSNDRVEQIFIKDVSDLTKTNFDFSSFDTVIHLANTAHGKSGYRFHDDTLSTSKIAQNAAEQGVKRFIFVSSIGVNGVECKSAFRPDDHPNPQTPYAKAKLASELELKKICSQTQMQYVIIRPPLVYSHDAPGNFKKLLSLVKAGVPIPLANVNNKRSFVAVTNLVSLVECTIDHPEAGNKIFLVSDNSDMSTVEFIRCIARNSNMSAMLISLPQIFLKIFCYAIGKGDQYNQLVVDLCVDISGTKETLGWHPEYTVDDELKFLSKPPI